MKTHFKIQQALIKAAFNRDTKKKPMLYRYGFIPKLPGNSDLVIVNESSTALYIVPRTYCFIDTLYVFKNQAENNFRNILAGAKEADSIKFTSRMYKKCHILIRVFENKEGEEIYVNDKLLKTFQPTEEYTYTGTTKQGLVYVYDECQDLIGCVCPIKY